MAMCSEERTEGSKLVALLANGTHNNGDHPSRYLIPPHDELTKLWRCWITIRIAAKREEHPNQK